MITYAAIVVGIAARILLLVGADFRWKYVALLMIAAIGGALFIPPIAFVIFTVFVFKRYILQPVTEGVFLLFGCLGAYVFLLQTTGFYSIIPGEYQTTVTLSYGVPQSYLFIFLLVYLSVAIALAITRIRSSKLLQVFYMILFMIISAWLTYVVSAASLSLNVPYWELALISFMYLPFIANIFYVLYFIPIPGKHQSIGDRLANIQKHARDVEEKYFDIDADTYVLLANVGFAAIFSAAHWFDLVSLPLAISMAVTCGALINRAPATSVFSPNRVSDY